MGCGRLSAATARYSMTAPPWAPGMRPTAMRPLPLNGPSRGASRIGIVVVENVERVIAEDGLGPKEAARKSMGQIQGALVGIALVLSAVFDLPSGAVLVLAMALVCTALASCMPAPPARG